MKPHAAGGPRPAVRHHRPHQPETPVPEDEAISGFDPARLAQLEIYVRDIAHLEVKKDRQSKALFGIGGAVIGAVVVYVVTLAPNNVVKSLAESRASAAAESSSVANTARINAETAANNAGTYFESTKGLSELAANHSKRAEDSAKRAEGAAERAVREFQARLEAITNSVDAANAGDLGPQLQSIAADVAAMSEGATRSRERIVNLEEQSTQLSRILDPLAQRIDDVFSGATPIPHLKANRITLEHEGRTFADAYMNRKGMPILQFLLGGGRDVELLGFPIEQFPQGPAFEVRWKMHGGDPTWNQWAKKP